MEPHLLGFRRFNLDTCVGLDGSATFSIALEVQQPSLARQRAIGAQEINTKQKPASRHRLDFALQSWAVALESSSGSRVRTWLVPTCRFPWREEVDHWRVCLSLKYPTGESQRASHSLCRVMSFLARFSKSGLKFIVRPDSEAEGRDGGIPAVSWPD